MNGEGRGYICLSFFYRFLRVSNKLIGDSSPEDQIKGMEILTNEVTCIKLCHNCVSSSQPILLQVMKINTKLPEVNAADKIGDIINGTVLKQISIYFTKLEVYVLYFPFSYITLFYSEHRTGTATDGRCHPRQILRNRSTTFLSIMRHHIENDHPRNARDFRKSENVFHEIRRESLAK